MSEQSPTPNPAAAAPAKATCEISGSRHNEIVSLRWEFRRHHLSEHERIVADWLLDLTLVKGRTSVKIARLQDLAGITGLDKSHVHRALKSLGEMRIVLADRKDAVMVLSISPAVNDWKCRFRQSRAQILEAMQIVEATNGSDAQFHANGTEDLIRFFDVLGGGFLSVESVADATVLGTLEEIEAESMEGI